MKGLIAVLRPLRKPALALVAAAGLVASGGGVGPVAVAVDGRAPIVPGQAVLAVLAHGTSPALGVVAPAASGLLIESGERQQLRLTGDGAPHQAVAAARPFRVGRAGALPGDGAVSGECARNRAALRCAPSTGPPSFPS